MIIRFLQVSLPPDLIPELKRTGTIIAPFQAGDSLHTYDPQNREVILEGWMKKIPKVAKRTTIANAFFLLDKHYKGVFSGAGESTTARRRWARAEAINARPVWMKVFKACLRSTGTRKDWVATAKAGLHPQAKVKTNKKTSLCRWPRRKV